MGGFVIPTKHTQCVIYAGDKESTTCYCGKVAGQYVESRDLWRVRFKKVCYFELDDTECAEEARREYEVEIVEQAGGGRWDWAWVEEADRTYNVGGEIETSKTIIERKRKFDPPKPSACLCGHSSRSHGGSFGTGRCTYEFTSRTNDGMDVIKGFCGCGVFRRAPESLQPKMTATPEFTRADLDTVREMTEKAAESIMVETRRVMQPEFVQKSLDAIRGWPGKVERERETVEKLVNIGKRARRDEGEV